MPPVKASKPAVLVEVDIEPVFLVTPGIDNKATGERIQKVRKAVKVGQGVLASRMGISQGYMSDLERGLRNWTVELVKQASDSLKALVREARQGGKEGDLNGRF